MKGNFRSAQEVRSLQIFVTGMQGGDQLGPNILVEIVGLHSSHEAKGTAKILRRMTGHRANSTSGKYARYSEKTPSMSSVKDS